MSTEERFLKRVMTVSEPVPRSGWIHACVKFLVILHSISSVRKHKVSVPHLNNSGTTTTSSSSSSNDWNQFFLSHSFDTLLFIPSLSRKVLWIALYSVKNSAWCSNSRTVHSQNPGYVVTSLVAPACYVNINRQFPMFRLTSKCQAWSTS